MKKVNYRLLMGLLSCATLGLPGLAEAWTPGNYPAAPERMHSAGFSVNNHDRNDVIAFWQAVYQASEGYETRIAWTGDYSGNNGTVSAAFVADVERRLNYFRAMCGVHSSASVNSNSTVIVDPEDLYKPSTSVLKSTAAQNAALMLIRNYNPNTGAAPALTHNPSPGLTGWSAAAWNATSKGNFAFGLYGPGAITEYMVEELSSNTTLSSWNSQVGHRRWNLFPKATAFATGDQPGTSAYRPPTNVFYVLQKPDEMSDAPGSQFVAYPAAGFFPAPINSPFWSVSCARADFSGANVRMTDGAGNVVPVGSVKRSDDYGHPAIVWHVDPAAAIRAVGGDTTFNVEISGIGGEGIPASHRYSVTLVNPDILNSDQQLYGPSAVASNGGASLAFTPPAGAEALQVDVSRRSDVKWKETAESASKTKVVARSARNYPLIASAKSSTGFVLTGGAAFRLTFPSAYDLIKRGVPEQIFELDRDIVASSKAKLTFQFRRGYMTRNSVLAVERSTDGGVTWKSLGSPIKGVSDTQFDAKASKASYKLPKSTAPIRIRFRYFTTGGAIYTHEAAPNSPTGIFLDEISTTNTFWLEPKRSNGLAAGATSFDFNASTAGGGMKKGETWYLCLRTRLGGKWFPRGPAKIVAIGAP